MKSRFRILSVDGGGLKGVIALRILGIISRFTGSAIIDCFDLMAGTSTGGLIVSALNSGRPGSDLRTIEKAYLEAGYTFFSGGGARLSSAHVQQFTQLVRNAVGNVRIGETALPLFIPAYDEAKERTVFFSTRKGRTDSSRNAELFDVCRATSAVPYVFPPHEFTYGGRTVSCVDAGFHLKNPALAALAEFWKHRAFYDADGVREADVVLVSVATGSHAAGSRHWSTDVSSIIGSQGVARRYMSEQAIHIDVASVNFLRVDLNFGGGSFSIEKLMKIGEELDNLEDDDAFKKRVLALLA